MHAIDPKPGDLIHGQVEVGVKPPWRTERTPVAMVGDDLWIAVKFQSNSEIAGSPRNSFRASCWLDYRRKALNGLGADKVTEPYQTLNAG